MDKVQKAIVVLLTGDGTFYAEFFIQARRIEGKLPPNALMAVTVKDGRIYLLTEESKLTKLTVEQVARGLQHEALHIIFEHAKRRGGRCPEKWNVAADLAINTLIPGMDIGLIPGQKEFKDFPQGKTAEEYYDMLPKEQEHDDGCGSASHEPPTDFDREVVRKAVEDAVRATEKTHGSLPHGVESAVREFIKKPSANWKQLLRQYVAATVKAGTKTTWRRENRRKLPIKGRLHDRILRLALAIDTSGSIFGSPELLEEFYSEIHGIQRAYNAEIRVIECDAEVQNTYKLRPGKNPNPQPKGGGGTSFKPPYQWLADHHERPDVLVYLTDLYGDFPEKEFIRTVWVVCEGGGSNVPLGRIIKIKR